MKRLSASVKVGILFLLLIGGSYGVWKTIGQRPSGASSFEVWARFGDASGLPEGSRVVIAGLPVGEIAKLSVDGRYARVTIRMREDVELYDNAIAIKKSASLLGDYFIEIDPGHAESVNAEGKTQVHRRLKSGDQIVHVIEATSPDQLMRRIEETLPKVDAVLLSVRDLSEDVRGLVNGPIASTFARVDRLVQDEAGTLGAILERTDRSIANIEAITRDIRSATADGGKFDRILGNLDEASAEAHGLVTSARSEIEQTGAALREKIDKVDDILEPTSSVMGKIDDDKGTLGRLVNDPTIADNIQDITDDAKGFLGTIFGMQTYVGLRTEYNVGAASGRFYVTLDVQTRPDKFYYIELEKGPRGDYPETTLTYDHATGLWRQDAIIRDKIRFTFQFAKRLDWATLRYGVKESTGGIGVDGEWFDRRLKLSVDIFDATFDQLPRLKVSAAYQFWGFLYVLAGADELLNPPETLVIDKIAGGVSGGDPVPIQFQELHFGRDYFFGAGLRFNDADLAALLTVGGSALAGVAK
jgi:phospholipid/cholesterol/gamma-HCH transport system substrate-binding protein